MDYVRFSHSAQIRGTGIPSAAPVGLSPLLETAGVQRCSDSYRSQVQLAAYRR